MASETKVEETKVEGTDTPKVEAKPVDERAIKLATSQEIALTRSATLESEIEAGKKLRVYAVAGIAHAETVRCWKASCDYTCEKNGVATSWNPAKFDDAISQITVRVRSVMPEVFENFDALSEKSGNPSKTNERISTRLRVGLVYQALVTLVGERVGELPYRIVANYLAVERVFQFSKQDVTGAIRTEHAEFLKTQIGLLCDGKSTTASFLNGLKQHYVDLEKAAKDKSDANLTPAERALRDSAAAEGALAVEKQKKISLVRERLAKYFSMAIGGLIAPDETATILNDAMKKADKKLPIGGLSVATITPDELKLFLEQVVTAGGQTPKERKVMRQYIMAIGSKLGEQARERKAAKDEATTSAVA